MGTEFSSLYCSVCYSTCRKIYVTHIAITTTGTNFAISKIKQSKVFNIVFLTS